MRILSRGYVLTLVGLIALGSAACSYDYSEIATTEAAAAEFARVRAQLGNQVSLVDIRADGSVVVHRSQTGREEDLHGFHTLVYEMPSRRLLRVNMPFRALRFLRRSGFTYLGQFYFLEDTEFDPIRVGLSLEDLERHGRGPIVDHRRSSGAQFLAWVD